MDPFYGGKIWTKHALQRAKERNLTQKEILNAIRHPTTSEDGQTHGSRKYIKVDKEKMVEVMVKENEKHQIVILSCWGNSSAKFKPRIPLWESMVRWFLARFFK